MHKSHSYTSSADRETQTHFPGVLETHTAARRPMTPLLSTHVLTLERHHMDNVRTVALCKKMFSRNRTLVSVFLLNRTLVFSFENVFTFWHYITGHAFFLLIRK